jgi:hypothetical protein
VEITLPIPEEASRGLGHLLSKREALGLEMRTYSLASFVFAEYKILALPDGRNWRFQWVSRVSNGRP